MIDLATLFGDLGILSGNVQANNQYEFFRGIIWDLGGGNTRTTYTQYDFFKQVGMSRYAFFKQYGSEREFYANIDDERIKDFYTFYKYAGEYFGESPIPDDWILETGVWNDSNVWDDDAQWID